MEETLSWRKGSGDAAWDGHFKHESDTLRSSAGSTGGSFFRPDLLWLVSAQTDTGPVAVEE